MGNIKVEVKQSSLLEGKEGIHITHSPSHTYQKNHYTYKAADQQQAFYLSQEPKPNWKSLKANR